ncbi:hypothetical protein [Burkholderia sp. TSV86]|uniref:hypothetical protein n=1 Tax=Burkholderia sp. TSV86 TaxID=1385594 RepID=UPI0012E3B509|nr:hypothetical protein [Burkholderia sp. TSV86]
MNKAPTSKWTIFFISALTAGAASIAHADTGSITWNNRTPHSYSIKIASHSQCVMAPDTTSHDVNRGGHQTYTFNINRNACSDNVWIVFNYIQIVSSNKIISGTVKYRETLDREYNLMARVSPSINYPSRVKPDGFRASCGPLALPCGQRSVKVGKTLVSINVVTLAALEATVSATAPIFR